MTGDMTGDGTDATRGRGRRILGLCRRPVDPIRPAWSAR